MLDNYTPKGKFLWDLWFIKDKGKYHIFYLQAKRTKHPEKRHDDKVSIGHAVSKDLKKYKVLPTALFPGKKSDWDSLSLWTGSVIKKANKYYLFYTGRDKKDKSVQKIGLAISDDIINWKKYEDNPVLEADKRYYQTDFKKNKLGKIGTWRDPFVFKHKDKYYMLISARKKTKKKEFNACIALAESDDLINWKILPPILSSNKFDEMETPQMISHENKFYLFFGVPEWKKTLKIPTGLYCYYSKNLKGPFKPVNRTGIVIDHAEDIYDIRLLHKKADDYLAIGWLNQDKKGKFIGKMSFPFKIKIKNNKVLRI